MKRFFVCRPLMVFLILLMLSCVGKADELNCKFESSSQSNLNMKVAIVGEHSAPWTVVSSYVFNGRNTVLPGHEHLFFLNGTTLAPGTHLIPITREDTAWPTTAILLVQAGDETLWCQDLVPGDASGPKNTRIFDAEIVELLDALAVPHPSLDTNVNTQICQEHRARLAIISIQHEDLYLPQLMRGPASNEDVGKALVRSVLQILTLFNDWNFATSVARVAGCI